MIEVQAPDHDGIIKLLKESLKTVKWESESGDDAAGHLHYTVEPAPGLKMVQVLPNDQAVFFADLTQPPAQHPGDEQPVGFTIVASQKPVDLKSSKPFFEYMVNKLSQPFDSQKIEAIHPLEAAGLKGFEATSILSLAKGKLEAFRYVAILFKSETQWYMFEGTAPLAKREEFEPKFKQMVQSFKLK